MDEYRAEVCPHCGNLRSVCSDPTRPWFPQRTICWASASQENIYRRWHKKYEKAEPDSQGYLPTDGTRLWVATDDLTPGDEFL